MKYKVLCWLSLWSNIYQKITLKTLHTRNTLSGTSCIAHCSGKLLDVSVGIGALAMFKLLRFGRWKSGNDRNLKHLATYEIGRFCKDTIHALALAEKSIYRSRNVLAWTLFSPETLTNFLFCKEATKPQIDNCLKWISYRRQASLLHTDSNETSYYLMSTALPQFASIFRTGEIKIC